MSGGNIATARCRMTTHTPIHPARGAVAAVCLGVLVILATPQIATATPVRIGEFFFDLPDGFSPTVHLTNESADPFSAFTVTFANDVFFDDGSTDVQSFDQTAPSLSPGDAFQAFPTDFAPPLSFVMPLNAVLTAFVYGPLGTITFSPDGGGTFLSSAVLDFSQLPYGLGIFFEAAQSPDPSPVPEPGTLILLATGIAAGMRRRRSFAASLPRVAVDRPAARLHS
jgi:hypothetical protein